MDSNISLPLDIPNTKVLETKISENGDFIITIESTQVGTNCGSSRIREQEGKVA
jgi:hypothetical protein